MDKTEEILEIIRDEGRLRLSQVSDSTDLEKAGLTSLSRMNVLLAIEDRYAISFPDEMLTKETFATVRSISVAVSKLIHNTVHLLLAYLSFGICELYEVATL